MTVASAIREALWRLLAPPEVRAAAGLTHGIFLVGHTAPPKRGTAELLKAYSELPWLRAITHKIGQSVGATTWQVFATKNVNEGGRPKYYRDRVAQRSDAGVRARRMTQLRKDKVLVEIEGHPVLDVLHSSNPMLGGMSPLGLSQIYLDLVGEAFMLKERNGLSRTLSLWPIPPNWVMELAIPGVRDTYRVNYMSWQAEIPVEEMLALADPDPFNPYLRGSGTARALNDELATDELAAKYTAGFFKNNARPDFIMQLENAGEPEIEEAKFRLEEQHRSVFRGFRPLVTNREVKITTISQKMRDMTFVELRKYQRDIAVQVFGMPPEILGIIESSNRATIAAAEFLFSKHVLVPRLEILRKVLQDHLVLEYDARLILDYVSPVEADRSFELEAMKAAPWAYDADEWREMGGRPALEDDAGKFYMVPFNLRPTPTPGESTPAPSPPPGDNGGPPLDDPDEEEMSLATGLRRWLEQATVTKISGGDIDGIVDAITSDEMVAATRAAHEEAILAFGQTEIEAAGLEFAFDMSDPRVVHWMETEAGEKITNLVTPRTKDIIRAELAAGVEAGENLSKLAERVRRSLPP